MTDLKFIKTFGLVLIGIGFVVVLTTALYTTHNVNDTYFAGLLGGLGIGLSLSGALLRLYSASNS